MWFSRISAIVLAFNCLVNAIPLEGNLGQENHLTKRAGPGGSKQPVNPAGSSGTAPPGKINTGAKQVTIKNLKYNGPAYPMSPNLDARKNLPSSGVQDILSEYKEIHGAWVPKPNTAELVKASVAGTVAVETDHIAEAQLISQWVEFVYKKMGAQGEWFIDHLLANHNIKYMTGKKAGQSVVDYSSKTYDGSLLQHILLELGSVKNLDRLAVLAKGTNGKKGIAFRDAEIDKDRLVSKMKTWQERQEAIFEVVRIDSYYKEELPGFVATIDGIYTILKKFDSDMGTAVTQGKMSGLSLNPSSKAPVTPQKPNTGTTSRYGRISKAPERSGASSAEVAEAVGASTPKSNKETPVKNQEDKQYSKAVGPNEPPLGSGDKNRDTWKDEPTAPTKLASLWVQSMNQQIKSAAVRIETFVQSTAKAETKLATYQALSAKDKAVWDKLLTFKVTFPAEMQKGSKALKASA